jgi:XTP/dITP diphosphohydrolase
VSTREERWVIATGNPGKKREIVEILTDTPVVLCSLEEFAPVKFPEEGTDYRVNALEKARAVAKQLGEVAVADDSGLEVEALDWGPGPLSARYGGEGLDDAGRVALMLERLLDLPEERRVARFVCAAALVTPDGDVVEAWGECRGRILGACRGDGGFGYDPIFQLEGRQVSMAELASEEKNRLSHRARAFGSLWDQVSG